VELEKAPNADGEDRRRFAAFVAEPLDVAGELIGGELRPQSARRIPTFGELGEQWTKGELAQR
jgi:hypothetical protein